VAPSDGVVLADLQGQPGQAPPPEALSMCKPSHLVAGEAMSYEVHGVAAGERVGFFFNRGAVGSRCFAFAPRPVWTWPCPLMRASGSLVQTVWPASIDGSPQA
jgi:hypothetical protein